MPCVVTAGVPMRTPEVTNGDRGSSGIGVPVEGDAGLVEHDLGVLAGEILVEAAQIDEQQMIVGPSATPGGIRAPPSASARARALATIWAA